ncbi:pyruvate, phosphate dikinase [candidate division KSB1 bacterium]
MDKHVYFFAQDKSEGRAAMKNLLGGKGANLSEMAHLGLPVPPGFTITTEVCTGYYENNKQYPEDLKNQVEFNLGKLEEEMGAEFGSMDNPLLVSCRSGARVSMPGMMDTILNIGLNDDAIQGVIKQTDNPRFAYDSYRRFIQMYGEVVMGMEFRPFENILNEIKSRRNVSHENELNVDELKEVCTHFKQVIKDSTDSPFPDDPKDQLWGAIGAVFESWDAPRAITYRKLNFIPDDWGTAVIVQTMVFGNMGDTSGTGVAFTRDPSTGEKEFYGEFLINAQGEDVVAGIRTPQPISKHQKTDGHQVSLEEAMPDVYAELTEYYKMLEKHYKDMQDLEFTIQNGKLFMLQTRSGKRTGFAALRIAVDLVDEKLIKPREAILKIEPEQLTHLLAPVFKTEERDKAVKEGRLLAKGLNAGPGAASGKIAFSADRAFEMANKGDKVILVRIETSPEDIHGMAAAMGILTAKGGITSHAAVVARGMGKCCITGCGDLEIYYDSNKMTVAGYTLKEGDYISIDGTTGEVIKDQLDTTPSEIVQVLIDKTMKPEDSAIYKQFHKFMEWVDVVGAMKVRTNADMPHEVEVALIFGAAGVGLCRTEHMFFEGDRIKAMREMIVANSSEGRKKALEKILPIQREDFIGIFRELKGKPATIRTLDPPLNEFLPKTRMAIAELAKELNISIEELQQKVNVLSEANPMLGHRGCRLGIAYPEITEMQVRAIMEAAVEVKKEGIDSDPEIMIPLVITPNELYLQRKVVEDTAEKVFEETGVRIKYQVGTMIELPRSALVADAIAEFAEFFSFGTNDLTQTTFGISRDDAGNFLPLYLQKNIFRWDPFQTIDMEGVGKLVEIGIEKGRSTRPDLKIGICGEHGGDPESVKFCYRVGMDYVSCSPYRVPVARLASAHAKIEEEGKNE